MEGGGGQGRGGEGELEGGPGQRGKAKLQSSEVSAEHSRHTSIHSPVIDVEMISLPLPSVLGMVVNGSYLHNVTIDK